MTTPNRTDEQTRQELETVEAMLSPGGWNWYRLIKERNRTSLLRYDFSHEGSTLGSLSLDIWARRGWTEESPF